MIQSIIHNEDTVEASLASLRREKFRNEDWDLLGWVWVPHHWDELHPCEHIHTKKKTNFMDKFVVFFAPKTG